MTKMAVKYMVPVWVYVDSNDPENVEKVVVDDEHDFDRRNALVEVVDDTLCPIRTANAMEREVALDIADNPNADWPGWEFGW